MSCTIALNLTSWPSTRLWLGVVLRDVRPATTPGRPSSALKWVSTWSSQLSPATLEENSFEIIIRGLVLAVIGTGISSGTTWPGIQRIWTTFCNGNTDNIINYYHISQGRHRRWLSDNTAQQDRTDVCRAVGRCLFSALLLLQPDLTDIWRLNHLVWFGVSQSSRRDTTLQT